MYARQSTAKTFILGPVLDGDGAADEGVVVGAIKVTKNGTVGAPNGGSTLTHDHVGIYKYAANLADFGSVGEVTFSLNDGTSAMAPRTFQVTSQTVYDSLVMGTDFLKTDVTEIDHSTTAAANVADVFLGTGAADDVDLSARSLTITNDAGTALDISGTTHGIAIAASAGPGIEIDGTTYGIDCVASNGPGMFIQGTTYGIHAQATGGTGIYAYGMDTNGHGIHAKGDATATGTGSGIFAEAGAVAPGFYAKGGATSGAGFYAAATANNDAGAEFVKHGTGVDLDADELGYLLAKACASNDITNTVVDQSVIAALLAVDGDISDYDDNTDSQEAIKVAVDTIQSAITAGFPTHEHADAEPTGGFITTGTNTDNDGDSTFVDDGAYWQVAATTAVGGFGLNMHQVFTLGTSKKANILKINAKETLVGVVLVWAYNYITPAWEQISDAVTGISGSSDVEYEYILNSDHQQTSDGEVKIRYTSTDESAAKYLYLDRVLIATVAISELTASEIARAVVEEDVLRVRHGEDGEMLLGHLLKRNIALSTTVTTENTTTSFTLTDGTTANDAYNGMLLEVQDESSGTRDIETRRIVDWTSGKVVTVDRAFSFTPTTGDTVHIHNKYADTNVTHLAGSSIQQASGYMKVSAGTGAGQLSLSSGIIESDMTKIHGTALTETSGLLAAGFKKFFNVATPAASVNDLARTGADSDTLETLSDEIAAVQTDMTILLGAGGGTTITITVKQNGNLIDGAAVYINSDTGGSDSGTKIAGTRITNSSGVVTFALDDGSYWAHVSRTGLDFSTSYPRQFTISGGSVSWA